jgi:hypothetical protein
LANFKRWKKSPYRWKLMTAFINQHHSKAKYLCFSLSRKILPIDLTEFKENSSVKKTHFMRC